MLSRQLNRADSSHTTTSFEFQPSWILFTCIPDCQRRLCYLTLARIINRLSTPSAFRRFFVNGSVSSGFWFLVSGLRFCFFAFFAAFCFFAFLLRLGFGRLAPLLEILLLETCILTHANKVNAHPLMIVRSLGLWPLRHMLCFFGEAFTWRRVSVLGSSRWSDEANLSYLVCLHYRARNRSTSCLLGCISCWQVQ